MIQLAIAMKADPFADQALAGPRAVAVIFDKPSTRTRVSFSVGVADLGGYPLVIDGATSQLGRGEPIADTARVLDRQCAAIVWRTFGQDRIEADGRGQLASRWSTPSPTSSTPARSSPTCMTVREHKGATAGLTLTYLGDGANNMAHSYLLGGALAGMHVRIGAPASHLPDPAVVARADGRSPTSTAGRSWSPTDAAAAVSGADVARHRHLGLDGPGGREGDARRDGQPVRAVRRRRRRPGARGGRRDRAALPARLPRPGDLRRRSSTGRSRSSGTRRRTGCTPRRRC